MVWLARVRDSPRLQPLLRAVQALGRGHALALCVVFAFAFGTRLYQLGSESLWIDEALSFVRARLPYHDLLADSIRRKHLPTYFLLLKAAMYFGDSEAALRLPSALLGVATCLVVYAIAAVVAGRLAGLLAGVLVALSRIQVHHGQEARMYTLLTFATSVAMLGFVWLACHREQACASFRSSWQNARAEASSQAGLARRALAAWLALLLGTVLALYSHNTGVFFLAALNVAALTLLLFWPGDRRAFAINWIACMLCVAALWAFWLPTLFAQSANMEHAWKGRPAIPSWIALVLGELFLLSSRGTLLAALLLAAGAYGLFVLRARKPVALALLALALVGPACAWIASQKVPMFYHRTLLWSPLPWFALCAVGVAGLPRIASRLALVVISVAAIPQLHDYYAAETKPAWRPLLQQLVQQSDDSSLILTARAERFMAYYFERHSDPLPPRAWIHPRIKQDGGIDAIVGDRSEFFVVAQTQERPFLSLRSAIAASGRYRMKWQKRSQNAVVIKYRRVKQF